MKNKLMNVWPLLLATTAVWTVAVSGGMWLLDSLLIRALPGNVAGLLVVGLLAVLVISLVQWVLRDDENYLYWAMANGVGLLSGMIGMAVAQSVARAPVIRGTTGVPLLDWLMWLVLLFVLAAAVSLPGGLLAGLFRKLAVGAGSILSWAAVSALNWALSFGTATVLVQLLSFTQFFYDGNFRHPATLLRGAAFGALVGLIQGAVLSRRLVFLARAEAAKQVPEMTDDELMDRLELSPRRGEKGEETGADPGEG